MIDHPVAYIVQEMTNHDVSPAYDFVRDIKVMLPPQMGQFSYVHAARDISLALKDVTIDDWLVLTGDPVLIGLATAEMAYRLDGTVKLLKWNRRENRYLPVVVNIREGVKDARATRLA